MVVNFVLVACIGCMCTVQFRRGAVFGSVVDPDPNPDPDPLVFGPPGSGSGSISQRYGSGSGSVFGSFHH
jgi:hypothetical protein